MNITSKSRYALKIMMDLALHQDHLTHRVEIAQRQGVPLDYMDQILLRLKEHQLIDSTRGRSGGYRLSRTPELISMFEIFNAVEDGFAPVQCLEGVHTCFAEQFCQSKDAWGTITNAIRDTLSGILLSQIALKGATSATEVLQDTREVSDNTHKSQQLKDFAQDSRLHECRAPKRSQSTSLPATREPKSS